MTNEGTSISNTEKMGQVHKFDQSVIKVESRSTSPKANREIAREGKE